MNQDAWYQNAFFYGIDVKSFRDGNGDGTGDFTGLTEKLDYLISLGVECIWLLPFYPSSGGDNGYDVTDYCAIDSRLGTLRDFQTFIDAAHRKGLRVMIDLVVHHTSNRHPWFLKAANNKKSRYRNYYIWREKITPEIQENNSFLDDEKGVWTYHPVARLYYRHVFYRFQPDLNLANPGVRKEVFKIIDFWLSRKVDGFRLDAVGLFFDKKGIPEATLKNKGGYFEQLHRYIAARSHSAILLGESDLSARELPFYFGGGRRLQMLMNFLLNNFLFGSLARRDARLLKTVLRKIPSPPLPGQWLNFVRNLDELNIQWLPPRHKEFTFRQFGPQKTMRVYSRGIRRRTAPMLRGNLKRLKMAYSLMFSLPGAPLVVYGDEIGMGERLDLKARESVRTPMQWSNTRNGGFSRAPGTSLVRPLVAQGPFSYRRVNVQDEEGNPDSLLNFMRALAQVRKRCNEIGFGRKQVYASPRELLVIRYASGGRRLLVVHNLSNKKISFSLKRDKHRKLYDLLSDDTYPSSDPARISVNGYGFRWFGVI